MLRRIGFANASDPTSTHNRKFTKEIAVFEKMIVGLSFSMMLMTPALADWQKFDDNCSDDSCTYIDLSAKTENVQGIIAGITILYDSVAISSAQMFGLSEVESVSFDCTQSRFRQEQSSGMKTEWRKGRG
jgi:hypothetical protein